LCPRASAFSRSLPLQAEAHAAAAGLRLVGLYVAEEAAAASELPLHALRLGEALHATCPGAVILLVRASWHGRPRATASRLTRVQADGAAAAARTGPSPPCAWRVRARGPRAQRSLTLRARARAREQLFTRESAGIWVAASDG
jgi:hypothetical protein